MCYRRRMTELETHVRKTLMNMIAYRSYRRQILLDRLHCLYAVDDASQLNSLLIFPTTSVLKHITSVLVSEEVVICQWLKLVTCRLAEGKPRRP